MADGSRACVVEAVSLDRTSPSVFLAGGITNCPDWQSEMCGLLSSVPLTLFNPRRKSFDVTDPLASERQIAWEYIHLRRADAVSFWFPSETLCPIVLFELGAQLAIGGRPIFIGVHPGYQRRADVLIQTRLSRPDIVVVDSLHVLASQVSAWAADFGRNFEPAPDLSREVNFRRSGAALESLFLKDPERLRNAQKAERFLQR
jgi:hypothetical protein